MSNPEIPPQSLLREEVKPKESNQIQRLRLKESVTIRGTSPMGFGSGSDAQITLAPTDDLGWFWQTQSGDRIEINLDMLRGGKFGVDKRHYLYFEHEGNKLKVVEHLLPLRFLGLDSVVISAPTADAWVPYDGGGGMYWKCIEDKITYDGVLEPLCMNADMSFSCDGGPNGRKRTVKLNTSPGGTSELVVTAEIDYPPFRGVGDSSVDIAELHFPLGNSSDMVDVITSKPLLKPAVLEQVVRVVSALGWDWPHKDRVLKLSEFDPNNPAPYLRQIALHRMLDLLGAYAVVMKGGTFLTGKLESAVGNHASDIASLKMLIELTKTSES